MTRRREFDRRLDAVEEQLNQRDTEFAATLVDDVPDEQVDAVIEASRKHLANESLDEDEARLRDRIERTDPV